MRKCFVIILILVHMCIPAEALGLTAPTVPEAAGDYMPSDPQNLQEGIRQVLKNAIEKFRPDLKEASRVCVGIVAVVTVVSLLQAIPGNGQRTLDLAGAVTVSGLFISSVGALVNLGAETVVAVSEYGKLLIPAMTAALAAQGGITTSAALYAGTMLFDSLLSGLIGKVLVPLIYLYLGMGIAGGAIGDEMLKKVKDAVKWFMTWSLKIVLYVFTGFISITGVVSGPTDAAALKAAKLTISGVVPVVGGILSDASEAVLVSAGAVKNSIGLYGLFAVLALWLDPFLKIGAHYLMLRATGLVCSIIGGKQISDLIQDFATAMGYLLAMTGAVCLLILISTVCFMRGVG